MKMQTPVQWDFSSHVDHIAKYSGDLCWDQVKWDLWEIPEHGHELHEYVGPNIPVGGSKGEHNGF